jgi:hypothetical protein
VLFDASLTLPRRLATAYTSLTLPVLRRRDAGQLPAKCGSKAASGGKARGALWPWSGLVRRQLLSIFVGLACFDALSGLAGASERRSRWWLVGWSIAAAASRPCGTCSECGVPLACVSHLFVSITGILQREHDCVRLTWRSWPEAPLCSAFTTISPSPSNQSTNQPTNLPRQADALPSRGTSRARAA